MQNLRQVSVVSVACLLTFVSYNKAYGQQNHTSTTTAILFIQPDRNVLADYRTNNNLNRNYAENSSGYSDAEAWLAFWVYFGLFCALAIVALLVCLIYKASVGISYEEVVRLTHENVKTINREFTKELADFKLCYEQMLKTSDPAASAHMIAQLTDIRQRLFNRVNEVRTRFRREKRAKSHRFKHPGCGLVSICYGCLFWSFVAFVVATAILYRNTDFLRWAMMYLCCPLSIVLMVLLFATYCMYDKKLLRHKSKSIEHAKQQIQAILDKPPYLRIRAEHYHESSNEGSIDEVVSKRTFSKKIQNFKYWRNEANNILADIHKRKLTVINVQVDIKYDGDEVIDNDMKNREKQFKATEPKLDQLIRYSIDNNYDTLIIAYPGTAPKWWISSKCFCFLLWIGFAWLYNTLLLFKRSDTEFTIVKRIYSRKPEIANNESSDVSLTLSNTLLESTIENECKTRTDSTSKASHSMSDQLNSTESEITSVLKSLKLTNKHLNDFVADEPLTAVCDDNYSCLTFHNINKLHEIITPTPILVDSAACSTTSLSFMY